MNYSFAISEEVLMKLERKKQRKAECQEKTNDQCFKGHWFIFRNLFLEIYSYTTVMVMCPKQEQNANWNQVEIEILIVRGRNLPRTNSTKSETQIIFAKKQENKHTPVLTRPPASRLLAVPYRKCPLAVNGKTSEEHSCQGCACFAEILTFF